MRASQRSVLPEVLDGLEADDPRGRRSRRDLQRVHRAMGSVSILMQAVAGLQLAAPPRRILELGAGDGTLLLRLARALRPHWTGVEATLLDRVDLVSAHTRAAYQALGWQVSVERADALAWAAAPAGRYDLCFANLFLHHFEGAALAALLRGIASASAAFVACEPRRSALARLGSRLIVLLGANGVTRADAVTSVAAGFSGQELSAAWPADAHRWSVREYPARPFSHCFTAVRTPVPAGAAAHAVR
jgi:SAM-dependent methyltransferase